MIESLSQYGYIRIASASPETLVANTVFNSKKIVDAVNIALDNKCNFILFPELSISAYTCGDLFFQQTLIENSNQAIEEICRLTKNKKVSLVVGAPIQSDGKLFNCAVFISSGDILGIIPKTYLCNSKEYYEERWFSSEFDRISDTVYLNGKQIPFGADIIFRQQEYPNASFGIEICEDLWTVKPPSFDLSIAGANVLLNLSASNELLTKVDYRRNLVKMQSARCFASYVFASSGPGESTTDTVFSGHCIISEFGNILSQTSRFNFETQITYADIDIERLNMERKFNNSFGGSLPSKSFRIIDFSLPEIQKKSLLRKINPLPFVPAEKYKRSEVCNEIFNIQTTALSKRIRHINNKKVVIGISGGLDSTLALIATFKTFEKLGLHKTGIYAISMPGFGTSQRTKTNAEKLAKSLGISFKTIDIKASVNQHFQDIEHNPNDKNIVYENAQARERTQILMDYANKLNGIVVGTGDLSEIALGWSTYNGDHISMYGINSGIPKTLVKYIIEWATEYLFDKEISEILTDIINTPISPELLPTNNKGEIQQETEKAIGPYELHDFFLYYAIRMNFSPKKIAFLSQIAFENKYTKIEITKWLKEFYNRFFTNQFKRSCMPDGVKVGTLALSPRADWRMPSDADKNIWIDELNKLD